MAQRFQLEYDDFGGGLNLRYAAHLIQKNEAQVANNVDLQDRAIKGLKDWSSSVSTFAQTGKFLWYSPAATFVSGTYSSETRFALNDGSHTYVTIEGQRPYVLTPGTSYSLGISPPTNVGYTISSSSGAKTGTYRYAITYVTLDGLESNPQDFDLVLSLIDGTTKLPIEANVSFTALPVSTESRVCARRIYRSMSNSDAMYFLAEVSDNTTTTFTDDLPDGALDVTRPLTWNDGGFPSSGGIYIEDHTPPPSLSVLSTGMHSASGTVSGRAGSGIVFGSVGSTVYWSMLGFPDYWPIVNQFSMPENVESIAALGGSTFVFTPNFIYQARGDSDDTISWSRSNTPYGVKKGYGRFTTPTTKGILFFGQDGLAVFDGSDARLVAEQKLPRTYYNSRTINAVGFFDTRFYVFCADGTVIYDFRDGITSPVITTSSHIANSATLANYTEPVTADALASLPQSILDLAVTVPGSYKVRNSSNTTYAVSATIAAPTTGTQATAKLQFGYDRIVVQNGGSGYTSVPTVTFTAPAGGGKPAKGVATVAGGKLISITLTDSGDGYSESEILAANLTLAGSGGSGATFDYYAKITGAQITEPGTGYTLQPKVTVSSTGAVDVVAQLFADVVPLTYQDASLVRVGSKLYRVGGIAITSPNPTSTVVNTVDEYSFSSRSWARLSVTTSELGGAVRGLGSDSDNSNAYFAGGTNGLTNAATSSAYVRWNGTAFTAIDSMPQARAFGSLHRLFGNTYYFGGYDSSGNLSGYVYRRDGVAGTWGVLSFTVGGTNYRIARHASVAIGSVVYIFGGVVDPNGAGAELNWRVFIWDTATDTLTIDATDGRTYGWAGRLNLQAAAYGGKIYLYGGAQSLTNQNDTSTVLSDLWVYDPSGSPKWQCRTGEVINAGPRARAGFVTDSSSGILYTVGGITRTSIATADCLSIPLAQASDCSGTPGLYVMDSSGDVRRFEGGSRMSDWTWQGRDEIGPKPGPKMTWVRARAAVVDSVKIGAAMYDTTGSNSWPTFATSAIGSNLGTQIRFWFPSVPTSPSNLIPRGQRISLKLGAANSSTTAEVHRVEIDAKMDTDGQS